MDRGVRAQSPPVVVQLKCMAMPDKERIRPVLVRRLQRAERLARSVAQVVNPSQREDLLQEVALAGLLLALADLEWEREEARTRIA